jgi:hypothetical protein
MPTCPPENTPREYPAQDVDLEEARDLAEASEAQADPPVTFPAEALPGEGSLWVNCKAYRAHQMHHRRDPATGAWRCYICQAVPGEAHPGERP